MTTKPIDEDLDLTALTLGRLAGLRRARAQHAHAMANRLPEGDPLRRSYTLAANSAHTEATDFDAAAELVLLEKTGAAVRS